MKLSKTTKRDPTQTKTLRESYRRDLMRLFRSYRRDALIALKRSEDQTTRMMAAADIDLIRLDEVLRSLGAALVTKGIHITRDHVLQNYTAGTVFGTKQLNRIGIEAVIGVGPADWRAMDALKVRNLSALRGVTNEMNKQIIRELSDGISLGESMPKLAKRLTDRVDHIGMTRATTIARTETLHAFNQGAELRYAQAGIDTLEWLSAHDPPRVCEECLALDGTTFKIKSNHPRPPIHPNCFIEGTRLEMTDDLIAATRAWYDGQVVKLTLLDGRKATVTPNHMLLTPAGFLAAKFVRDGDDIICRAGFEGVQLGIDPNKDNVQPTVEEVFSSFSVSDGVTSRSMPATPVDFHNDGKFIEGNIDIVTSDRFLLGADDSTFNKHIHHDRFGSTDSEPINLSVDGDLASVLVGLAFAADGGMSSRRKTSSFFGGRLAHPEIHGFAAVPGIDPILNESESDDVTGTSEVRSELFNGQSRVVQSQKFWDVDVDSPGWMDSEVGESAADGVCANTIIISDLLDRHSGLVEVQKVVGVDVNPSYHGYIYDFQTLSTLCIGNGVVTSNCRCAVIPVLENR